MTKEEASGVLTMLKKRELNALKIRKYPFPQRTLTIAQALTMAIEALSADRPSGEWQRVDEQPYFRKHYHKMCCSICHKQGSEKYNYCPNCGARMKGGAE